ncbi:BON domain-containing protein [Candidatus Nitrospira bockiana]
MTRGFTGTPRNVATIVLSAVLLGALPVEGDEPLKPAEPKPTPPKLQEAPKQPEAKPETKPSEPKAATPTHPKAGDAKPEAPKPAEPPKPAEKAPDGKPAEGKAATAPAPKAQESKPEPAKPTGPPAVAIKLAFMADSRLFPYELNVDMHGDTAELSGKVGSEAEKALAAEIAQTVEGVKTVTNNLEITKDLPQSLARKRDETITQYVKERFARSKTLESAHFEVKTEEGVVSLSGKTKFLVIALEAAEAARQVPGVKAVRSDGVRLETAE